MSSMEHFENYRNVEVQGALGKIILRSAPMPLELAREIWAREEHIPLDVVPDEFWHPPELPFPRFGEEMLGADF